ncbi:hypothetical protein N9878_01330 [bacterium]|nr:hypothetical protein [bacterium]
MAKAPPNPRTGITDGKLRTTLRSAMRMIWSRTVKKQYVNGVRYKLNGKFHVRCVACNLDMAISAKAKPINKDGSLSRRRPQKLFDVDHVDGITPLGDPIRELGPYWQSMMLGELRILCKACHLEVTDKQREARRGG